MAVLAEVVITNHYFRRDSIVAEAYDFLEEKRQVEVTPRELINEVAASAYAGNTRPSFRSPLTSLLVMIIDLVSY